MQLASTSSKAVNKLSGQQKTRVAKANTTQAVKTTPHIN